MKDTEDGIIVQFFQYKGGCSDKINSQKMDYLLVQKFDEENPENPNYRFYKHSVMLNETNESEEIFHSGFKNENTFVIANAGDQAYIQYIMPFSVVDELSLGLLSKIPNSIDRIIIWRSLISMTSKLMIAPQKLFKIVIENICEEDDLVVLDCLLSTFAA